MKKRNICRKRTQKQVIVITEAQIHQAFHELALTECKKWVRRRDGNVPIRIRD